MMITRSWSEMASSFVRVVVVWQQKERICVTQLLFNFSCQKSPSFPRLKSEIEYCGEQPDCFVSESLSFYYICKFLSPETPDSIFDSLYRNILLVD